MVNLGLKRQQTPCDTSKSVVFAMEEQESWKGFTPLTRFALDLPNRFFIDSKLTNFTQCLRGTNENIALKPVSVPQDILLHLSKWFSYIFIFHPFFSPTLPLPSGPIPKTEQAQHIYVYALEYLCFSSSKLLFSFSWLQCTLDQGCAKPRRIKSLDQLGLTGCNGKAHTYLPNSRQNYSSSA